MAVAPEAGPKAGVRIKETGSDGRIAGQTFS